MARSKSAPSPVVTVLPVLPGMAYQAEVIAPVITEWLTAAGVATRGVSGMDVRNVVRGRRKGVPSPIIRLLTRPAFGNRTHLYTVEEAAALFSTFARIHGVPDLTLPVPFKGHGLGERPARPVRTAAAVKAARAKRADADAGGPSARMDAASRKAAAADARSRAAE